MNEFPMQESDVEDMLYNLLINTEEIKGINTFEGRGVLTQNSGLVIETEGREFQITIVRSN
jgi:hypothetical protein